MHVQNMHNYGKTVLYYGRTLTLSKRGPRRRPERVSGGGAAQLLPDCPPPETAEKGH
jgi:hypothetical protein